MPTTSSKSAAAIITLGVALVHLLIAPSVDLSVDEAHYGLYARFLDWSYFDHPPMVGWLLYLFKPLGLNEFTLRLPAAAIYVLCSYLLYQIGSDRMQHGSGNKGLVAVILFSTTPMVQLLGFGLVPEFPLLLWTLLLAVLVSQQHRYQETGFWLCTGLLLGLAGLTKYTAILLVPGLALYWLIQGQLARVLKQPRAYLAIAMAVIVVSPVFAWNYRHDWASFHYQIDHAGGGEWELRELLRALGVQLLAYSPLVVIGGLIALKDIAQPGIRGLLVCLALPILLFVFVSSGNGASLPHWSLLGWSLLIPSLSHWLVEGWHQRSVRLLARFGTGVALVLSILILYLLAFKPLATMPWAALALRDVSGWKAAAIIANRLREQHFSEQGVIMVPNWSRASRIAWYGWPTPVQVLDDSPGQFVYWYGAVSPQTRGILIRDNVDEEDGPTSAFSKLGLWCDYLEQTTAVEQGIEVNRFYFYVCVPQDTRQTSKNTGA